MIERTRKIVRPQRTDGYVNLLNKYGTKQDNSEAYSYQSEPVTDDMSLTTLYESNGLFAKIIDTPSEEALKHGFDLGVSDPDIESFIEDALDELDWEEKATTGIKWARLYGGAIGVMLIDDGGGLDEPLNWKKIKSIDEIRIFERAVVNPDYTSLYSYDTGSTKGNKTSRFGTPEFYDVLSRWGSFRVHSSRCLVFKNGVLPEKVTATNYQYWGIPEYVRIRKALQETITTHQNGTKLMERSVQPIYKMSGLANLMSSDDGEDEVLKRLYLVDSSRGILNSIAIDNDGEDYDFKTFQFAGVSEVIDTTCNMLSAVTNIPQTILFGRSPAGMNATGESDLENYYNYIERIQKLMVRRNLRDLLDVIFRAAVKSGDLEEEPKYKLKFNPLWSLNDTEQATVDKTKADTEYVKAQTAQLYVDMQALDPTEVRKGLAASDDFDVEDLISEDEDLLSSLFGGPEGGNEAEAEEKTAKELDAPGGSEQTTATPATTALDSIDATTGVGCLVIREGKILTGARVNEGTIGGPGGHIEAGETPEAAIIRETMEEFGIRLGAEDLIPLGIIEGLPKEHGRPMLYMCTRFEGEPKPDGVEMKTAKFLSLPAVIKLIEDGKAFKPFAESVDVLLDELGQGVGRQHNSTAVDGGPGSGRYPKGSGDVDPEGANEFSSGFSKSNGKAHYRKHKKNYPGISQEEYEATALELIQKPVGGNIRGYESKDGRIVRYNTETKDFVSGHPGKGIATMMKLEKGTERYEYLEKRDGK